MEKQLRTLGNRKVNEGSQQVRNSSPPPGFEIDMGRIITNHNSQTELKSKNNDGQLRLIEEELNDHPISLGSPRHGGRTNFW